MRLRDGVTADPRICGGKPVIEGTRVAVSIVVGSLAAGMTTEEVCKEYRLTRQQVQAALAYAAEAVEEEGVVPLPSR